MSSFVLKIIAIISMSCDHIGYPIFNKFSFMNYLGRLAFPIFAFSISEGYSHTKNLRKYYLRLFILAIISQIPYSLYLSTFTSNFLRINILFTLLLGLFVIDVYERLNNKYTGILFAIICMCIAHFLQLDYGWLGVAVIFIFHIFKDKKLLMNLSFIIVTFINYGYKYITTLSIEYIFMIFFIILSLIPINLYNGKKGKDTKYILYIFYPIHLLIIYIIKYYCF